MMTKEEINEIDQKMEERVKEKIRKDKKFMMVRKVVEWYVGKNKEIDKRKYEGQNERQHRMVMR